MDLIASTTLTGLQGSLDKSNVALDTTDVATDFPGLSFSDVGISAKWWFEFVFCAVSLAVVWGTTLERIKFSAYVIYAVIFSALIYPVLSHWIFGGGWLQ